MTALAKTDKRRKGKTAAVYSDMGTPERERHGQYVTDKVANADTSQRDRRRYLLNTPLEHYRSTRLITARQREAGYKLHELYYAMGLQGHVTGQYRERVDTGEVSGAQIIRIKQFQRYKAALKRLLPSERQAVIRVCCHEERLRYGGGPHLVAGLRKLARFFGV